MCSFSKTDNINERNVLHASVWVLQQLNIKNRVEVRTLKFSVLFRMTNIGMFSYVVFK